MKRYIIIAMALMMLAAAATAMAQQGRRGAWGEGSYMGPGYSWGVDEEQIEKYYDCRQRFYEKVNPMRTRLYSLMAELDSLMYRENPNQKRIEQLVQEINTLRGKIFKESVDFRLEAYGETGMACSVPGMGGWGGMMGPGMMGPGHGRGMRGWGHGPGMMGY